MNRQSKNCLLMSLLIVDVFQTVYFHVYLTMRHCHGNFSKLSLTVHGCASFQNLVAVCFCLIAFHVYIESSLYCRCSLQNVLYIIKRSKCRNGTGLLQ